MRYIGEYNVLSQIEFAFLNRRSTTLQLIKALDEWTETMDSRQEGDLIYLNLRKAFDTVSHARLLGMRENYDIKGKKWFE